MHAYAQLAALSGTAAAQVHIPNVTRGSEEAQWNSSCAQLPEA